jgi:hypothetical protein
VAQLARSEREALLSAAAAAGLGAILLWLGPAGTDFAAHAYQRTLYLQHGFVLWNNFWYAGRYPFVTYSLLYYPLAALVGIKVLALASVTTAALAFAVVVGREWGPAARLSTRSFAVLWAGIVLSAAFPFALGAALVLLALWALQAGRRWRFALLAVLSLAASPLAFLLLLTLLAGIGIARRDACLLSVPAVVVGFAALAELVVYRLFPTPGHYPFSPFQFFAMMLFCAYGALLTRGVERARTLRWMLVVYLVAGVVSFVVPSDLGGNVSRLRYAALPIALLAASLRRWRPLWLVVPAVVLATAWNLTPLVASFARGEGDPGAAPAYWTPAVHFLHRHLSPDYRVEVVDTSRHWAAVYLPEAGIPLVRGWYRQADFPANALLYDRFGPHAYVRWLRSLGVRYVVRTDAPPDYSAEAESDLLAGGHSGLRVAFRSAHETVYRVPRPRALVTGPGGAHVTAMTEAGMRIVVVAPGRYRVAVRYSPYWHTEQGCVERRTDGMVGLALPRSGPVELNFQLGPTRMLKTLIGQTERRCG